MLYVIDHDVMEVGSSVVVVAYTTPTWRSGVFDDNGDDDDGDGDDDDDDDDDDGDGDGNDIERYTWPFSILTMLD